MASISSHIMVYTSSRAHYLLKSFKKMSSCFLYCMCFFLHFCLLMSLLSILCMLLRHTGFSFCCHGDQLAGCSSNHGQVEIFSLNRTTPGLVKTFPLRAPVLCLEYVKEPCPSAEEKEAEKAQTADRTGNIICVGLQDGRSAVFTAVVLTFYLVEFVICVKTVHTYTTC